MIKVVIFDVDGVLNDSFEANFRFFSDLMPHFGYAAPTKEEYMTLFHKPMIDVIRILSKSESESEIEKIYKTGMGREIDYDTSLLKIPDHAKETIQILAKDYLLGIVTGRIRESVFESPELAKLKKHFKVVVAYQDTTNHKPHPEPLLLAAQKLGVAPEYCVYVGDVENDIIAAKVAGMKSILFSKNTLASADADTSIFTELPKLISLI